jgi:hypothetical protein
MTFFLNLQNKIPTFEGMYYAEQDLKASFFPSGNKVCSFKGTVIRHYTTGKREYVSSVTGSNSFKCYSNYVTDK